ncbi:hypothetical protein [Gordonibacter sp. Marseille-P4307]|uniref:hypothetical protein n=1 Tax=Gordonibacter sp. Marseille-P4307 TaxID=2161815 RepID=UPI000F51BEE0|nr:hypothetical protein [Gordonibacter sp. Marseille-P4307]
MTSGAEGFVLFMWIVIILVWVGAVAICTSSQVALVVRSIQICLYTYLAPIPSATIASDALTPKSHKFSDP